MEWRWSNPFPHGNNVVDMAFSESAGYAIQVAERGQIYTSVNLADWTPRNSGTTRSLRGVAFLGDRVVISGEAGTVLYADTPNQILPGTLEDGATEDWLEGVTASETLAVAVGDYGAIYTSEDGVSWRRRASPVTQWLRGVAAGVDGFIAVGEEGMILRSADGTNWVTQVSNTGEHLNRVHYEAGAYLVAGNAGLFLVSTDEGLTWDPQSPPGALNDLLCAAISGAQRLTAGSGEVWLSYSGSWLDELDQEWAPPLWDYYAALGWPGYLLLAGQTGLMAEGAPKGGGHFQWAPLDESVRTWLFDIAAVDNLYVAVGDRGTVVTSTSGIDWSEEIVPERLVSTVLLGVGGDTNLLVAVGSGGGLMISPNILTNIVITNGDNTITQTVSTLGVLWQDPGMNLTSSDLQGVTYSGSRYVVTGGGGSIFTSPDGTNWTQQVSPTTSLLSSVAASPDILVAVGDNGVIVTSPEGDDWTLVPTALTNWLYRVRYLDGEFLVVGENGLILRSQDGVEWSTETSGSEAWLTDATRIGDRYYVLGSYGTVVSSTNGVDWLEEEIITYKSLYGAASLAGRLVVVGTEGAILRSDVMPDLTPVEILDYTHVEDDAAGLTEDLFLFGGRPGQRFTVDDRMGFDEGETWRRGSELEILDPSGTLYFFRSYPTTNALPALYYRATLVE